MAGKRAFLAAGAFALAALLSSTAAFAETFELPGQEQLVYYGSLYTGGGPSPQYSEMYAGYDYYGWTPHIYYRVLVDGNGKETVLDSYKTSGTRTIYSWRNDLEGHRYVYFDLPALNVSIDQPGTYIVEFREIVINRPTDNRFPGADLGATIDLWDVNYYAFNDRPVECTRQYYNDCYIEYLKQADVPLSSLAETLSVTEIEFYQNTELETPVKPYAASSSESPFDPNTGDAKEQPDIPLAVAALGGIALASAAVLASGSRIRTFFTAAGQRAEEAKAAARAQMEADEKAYAAWYADQQAAKKTAKLIKEKEELIKRILASGPTGMMTLPKNVTPIPETISRGTFNFLEAFDLKSNFGYSMADALGIAYDRNEAVGAINDLINTIETTQAARIEVADKYPWPVSSCVKFSASFAKETSIAVASLIGNGFFAAGSLAALLADSMLNPKDAGENLSVIGEVVMGSLFRGVSRVGSTIKNEPLEVSAGLVAGIVIAPEDAFLQSGGKLVRASTVVRRAEKGTIEELASRTARNSDVGIEISERTAIKTVEHGELGSLSQLIEDTGKVERGDMGKTLIDVSDVNNEKTR